MFRIITAAVALVAMTSFFAVKPTLAASCKEEAAAKKLVGAALKSFMGRCERDAQSSCNTQAAKQKLAGAAKNSFTKKCVNDAVGNP